VGYLNARPLTWALDRSPDHWQVRYDLPSVCAALLHSGETDLGLIPSVEYLQSPDYRFVPGVGIGSRGAIASVALYTRVPVGEVRTLALDTSSRTSVSLIKVLCHHRFHIAPDFLSHGPDLAAMTRTCDAGLLIGDPAFDADHAALGLTDIHIMHRML
jgi:predicted solute-binding protein